MFIYWKNVSFSGYTIGENGETSSICVEMLTSSILCMSCANKWNYREFKSNAHSVSVAILFLLLSLHLSSLFEHVNKIMCLSELQ